MKKQLLNGKAALVVLGILLALGATGFLVWHLDWLLPGGRDVSSSPAQDVSDETPPSVEIPKNRLQEAAGAGLFYPADANALAEQIDQLLEQAEDVPVKNIRAIIVPCGDPPSPRADGTRPSSMGGLAYGGKVAAAAYKQLKGREYSSVIILGASHYAAFSGAAVADVDGFQTPLGTVRQSSRFASMANNPPFVLNPKAAVVRPPWWKQSHMELPSFGQDSVHTWEQSIEVQLPFLQRTLKRFTVLPVVVGNVEPLALAQALSTEIAESSLVVVSADLSRDYPGMMAGKIDAACVKALIDLDVEALKKQESANLKSIEALLYLAKRKGWQAKLLDLSNSGATAGDMISVVGYGAVAFYDPGPEVRERLAQARGPGAEDWPTQAPEYSPRQRKQLINRVRQDLAVAVKDRRGPTFDANGVDAKLMEPRGNFVMLQMDGNLRGMAGFVAPQAALFIGAIANGINAGLSDKRFTPVTPAELDKITIEIHIMTPIKRLEAIDPLDILAQLRPSVDGVALVAGPDGRQQGLLLPPVWNQVPNKATMMQALSQSAGLPPDGWKTPGAQVYVFQEEVIRETDPSLQNVSTEPAPSTGPGPSTEPATAPAPSIGSPPAHSTISGQGVAPASSEPSAPPDRPTEAAASQPNAPQTRPDSAGH